MSSRREQHGDSQQRGFSRDLARWFAEEMLRFGKFRGAIRIEGQIDCGDDSVVEVEPDAVDRDIEHVSPTPVESERDVHTYFASVQAGDDDAVFDPFDSPAADDEPRARISTSVERIRSPWRARGIRSPWGDVVSEPAPDEPSTSSSDQLGEDVEADIAADVETDVERACEAIEEFLVEAVADERVDLPIVPVDEGIDNDVVRDDDVSNDDVVVDGEAVETSRVLPIETEADFQAWLDSIAEDAPAAQSPESTPTEESEEDSGAVESASPDEPTDERFAATLLECMMLFGLVIIGELAITGRVGSIDVHPHPYWLVVIPMAATRGLIGALLAAGAGFLLYAIGVREASDGDFMAIVDLARMQEPLLFFAVGFVIGEFRDAALRQRRALWRAFSQREEDTELLRQEKELLAEANHAIKRRLVDNASQFGYLIRTATRLEASDDSELFDVALEMIEEHCGATHCAVLAVLEGQLLDVAAYRGYESEGLRELLTAAESSPLIARVLDTGTRVNGFASDSDLVGEGPLVVAPIADATGVVRQLLCLDRIPVRAFNDSTVMTFYGIADWVSVTLRRATHGNQALDFRLGLREAISIGPWIGCAKQLGERVRVEDARCSRQGILSALITVQCIGTHEDAGVVEKFVSDQLLTSLRPTDGVYRFGYPGCFVLVLSGTDPDQCQAVQERIDRRIENFSDRPFERWETRAYAPDLESPDLASILPRVASTFRENSEYALDAEVPVTVADRVDVGHLDDFVRRLRTEWSIALRNEIELYVVEIRDDTADAKRGHVLARHIETVGREILRATDGIYRTAVGRFSIVMPGATCEGAFGSLARILEAVEQRTSHEISAPLESEVYALGSDYEQYERFLSRMLGEEVPDTPAETPPKPGIDGAFEVLDPVAEPIVEPASVETTPRVPTPPEPIVQPTSSSLEDDDGDLFAGLDEAMSLLRDGPVEDLFEDTSELETVLADPFADTSANADPAVAPGDDLREISIDDELDRVLHDPFVEAEGSVETRGITPAGPVPLDDPFECLEDDSVLELLDDFEDAQKPSPPPAKSARSLGDGLDDLAELANRFSRGDLSAMEDLAALREDELDPDADGSPTP